MLVEEPFICQKHTPPPPIIPLAYSVAMRDVAVALRNRGDFPRASGRADGVAGF